MADTEFAKKVKEFAERKRETEKKVDWAERKHWWQSKVSALMGQIEKWISPLVTSGAVTFSRAMRPISEETLGAYETESVVIHLGSDNLRFVPIASVIVGAYGRIDVEGPNGRAMLLLIDDDKSVGTEERRAKAEWYVTYPMLHPRSIPKNDRALRLLNESTFQQLFSDLFGIQG